MSISSVSSSSYYSTSSIYQKKYASETDDTTEAQEVLASLQQTNDVAPPPKPPEEDGTNPEDAVYSVEDLTDYLDFVANEYGIEVDATEFTEGKETLTGSDIKSFLEENGLEFSTPKEPPKEPPMMNSTEEQMNIMSLMQSNSTLTAQNINVATVEKSDASDDLLSLLEEIKNASSEEESSTTLEDLLLDA